MDYDELKELVKSKDPNNKEYIFMTNTINDIYLHLSQLTDKLMKDLSLSYPSSPISVGSNAVKTSAGITIGKRQINFNYKDSKIKVLCYEPGVINKDIGVLKYVPENKIIHEDSKQEFKITDIDKYLEWFKE